MVGSIVAETFCFASEDRSGATEECNRFDQAKGLKPSTSFLPSGRRVRAIGGRQRREMHTWGIPNDRFNQRESTT